ncbi:hypothetical protein [Stagnihabitans tardus]|uniref:Uncharacterized protein n=1 Tax=Stagnihabitans tardus TaxID=2699202 RepID=A0AAE5BXJ4_9RHOB|nr:hypothetical protein [Stagnihabitans tardus]NBZ90079.1 hypothetical protein [Stagnihabitans tardus]
MITLVFMMILFSILALLQARGQANTAQLSALLRNLEHQADADSAYDLVRTMFGRASPDPSLGPPRVFASAEQMLLVPGGDFALRLQDPEGVIDIYLDPLPAANSSGPLMGEVIAAIGRLRESDKVYPTLTASLAAAGLKPTEIDSVIEVTTQGSSLIGLRMESCPEALCPGGAWPVGMQSEDVYGQVVQIRIQ